MGSRSQAGPVAEVMSRPDILPVVGRFDLGTILDCAVARHDELYQLSTLAFADGQLRVPLVDQPVGAPVRARVRSRDVSIALSRPVDVSVSNLFAGTVSVIRRIEGPYADVEIAVGATALHAQVTHESVERLALKPGMPVWAMVKTVAVDSRSPLFNGSAGDGVAGGVGAAGLGAASGIACQSSASAARKSSAALREALALSRSMPR